MLCDICPGDKKKVLTTGITGSSTKSYIYHVQCCFPMLNFENWGHSEISNAYHREHFYDTQFAIKT